ncbi:hypothetical protein LIER_21248 [Lithospermum erythrorhizon]|uniref:Uncharacterized protein n=1 Tax=Lithospermum erythrorhizon TaxID=34254 RepID=A0AAV3QQR1_LITER
MTWVIRKVRCLFIEDCVQILCEVYDEFFTVKVHVLDEFKLYPTLVYEGGTTIDVDWLNLNLFDLKDVDEFGLRSGYDVDSRLFYAYKEPEIELICGLKPLLCDDDVVQFRELTSKRRDDDGFDVELDDEIREEAMAQKKEMLDKVDKIAKENAIKKKKKGNRKWQKLDKNRILGLDELEEGIGSSSQSKKKLPGPYARHGLKFKTRKEAVKRVNRNHNGCRDVKIRLCNNTFLAKTLEGKLKLLPELDLATIRVFVDQMFKIKLSRNSARNTKEKALKKINGDDIEQFNLCHTYCQELIKAHPGSTCFVEFVESNKPTDPCIFQMLYICLKSLVNEFHAGCRKDLDGCHI